MMATSDSELKRAILEARAAISIWRAELWLKRYDPNQPRVPAGRPDGGNGLATVM